MLVGQSEVTPIHAIRDMASAPGTFTISLDFELYWGVHDHRPLAAYARNLLGARDAIPRMLELFERYGVHCTWATVGLLFFDRKADLMEHLPEPRPRYANPALSPYPRIGQIGPNERQDPYHYGLSLIEQIRDCPGPGDRHPHLLALLLSGAGRDRGRAERGDIPRRSAGGAPRRRAARHHAAQPGLPPQPVPRPTIWKPVAPRGSRWSAATIRPGGFVPRARAPRA